MAIYYLLRTILVLFAHQTYIMGKKIKNPHDKYFSAVFSYKSITISFLKSFLPQKYLEKLDIDSIDRTSGSFIDEHLQEYFSDMLYRCPLKDTEEEIWISLLLEHKSYVDFNTEFQLLSYMNNGWAQDIKEGRKRRFILPIVLYHGDERWKRKGIIDYFEQIGEHFIPFLPKFEYILIDFSQYSEKDLLDMHLEAMVLNLAMVFKFGRNKEYVVNHINRIFLRTQEYSDINTGENFIRISFVYLLELVEIPEEKWPVILKLLPKPIKNTAMTLYDNILKKGEQKGMQKGEQIGMQKVIKTIQLLSKGESPEAIAKKMNVDIALILEIKESLNS